MFFTSRIKFFIFHRLNHIITQTYITQIHANLNSNCHLFWFGTNNIELFLTQTNKRHNIQIINIFLNKNLQSKLKGWFLFNTNNHHKNCTIHYNARTETTACNSKLNTYSTKILQVTFIIKETNKILNLCLIFQSHANK